MKRCHVIFFKKKQKHSPSIDGVLSINLAQGRTVFDIKEANYSKLMRESLTCFHTVHAANAVHMNLHEQLPSNFHLDNMLMRTACANSLVFESVGVLRV